MGAFDRKEETETTCAQAQQLVDLANTIEIHGQGGGADQVVIARTKVNADDESWVMSALLTILVNQDRHNCLTEVEQLKLVDRLWLERLIVSWTLPLDLEKDRAKAIATLSQADRDYLYQRIMATQPKKDIKLGLGARRDPSPNLKKALQTRAKRFSKVAVT